MTHDITDTPSRLLHHRPRHERFDTAHTAPAGTRRRPSAPKNAGTAIALAVLAGIAIGGCSGDDDADDDVADDAIAAQGSDGGVDPAPPAPAPDAPAPDAADDQETVVDDPPAADEELESPEVADAPDVDDAVAPDEPPEADEPVGPDANGVLVVPADAGASAERALARRSRLLAAALRNDGCPNVPEGYAPLAGASIEWIDADGVPIDEPFVGDDCGAFSAVVPDGAARLRAEGAGYRPIESDVTLFVAPADDPGIASTIPESAVYRIGSIQAVDDDTLAFAVTDTETGQAVLGVPASVFRIALDGADATVASIGTAAATAADASSVLVLDASGSMGANAYTDPDTGERLERVQLAALAAHTFLDGKAQGDEVAALPFSSRLYFMDQETIDRELPLVDPAGEPTSYLLSEDGFVTDARRMRLVVDAYNRRSELYGGDDERHPDTPPDVTAAGRYPFAGSTALYDAIGEAVVRLDARDVARPVVVAMTDGADNSSVRDVEQAIDEAVAANVPVYTIGFGGGTREDLLTRVADETGGSFFSVTSLDIANVYQSIQTGIVFQYVAELEGGGLDDAFTLGVSLDYNGLQAERTLTVAP